MEKLILLLVILNISMAQRVFDMEYICGQDLTVFDIDILVNGKASNKPDQIIPTDCVITLEAGYTDSEYRLELIFEAINIQDCSTYFDIFNGKGAYGDYLRRLGCRSMSTDTIYSDTQFVTVRLHRPINLPSNAYMFTLKIKAYRESDLPITGRELPTGAIVGIILGILSLVVVAVLLGWCWRSGRLTEWTTNDAENEDGEDKLAKSEISSLASGVDNRNVWNTSSDKYDTNSIRRTDGPQFLGRRSYRNTQSRTSENGVQVTTTGNGVQSATWQKQETDLKQSLNNEIRQGSREQTNLKQSLNSEIRQGSRNLRQSNNGRKETLVDDVFESDDNQVNDKNRRLLSHGGDDAYDKVETPQYLKKNNFEYGEGDNRVSGRSKGDETSTRDSRKRGDDSPSRGPRRQGESPNRESGRRREEESPTRGSLRRKQGDSPIRGSLRRDKEGRDSKRSVGSNKEGKMTAQTLAAEALGAKLKSRSGDARKLEELDLNQVDPPSDFDSSSFMSVPEPAVITASIHSPNKQPLTTHDSQRNKDRDSSEDSELREINNRAVQEQPNNGNGSKKSPKNKKKKKSKDQENRVPEDVLPPEAFEPLFDRPVSEDPLPSGMQPLNVGFNPYGGMYPVPGYGMPYGMMPPPGTVPPGTQTYAYAYQNMPGPGMAPQQVSGKAAYFVQETPTKHGPVQKTAFMMATQESRPHSQDGHNNDLQTPGNPGYTSTPYGSSPRHTGSGPRGGNKPMSMVPGGALPRDNGQGHRSAMMKSGVDPNTGIETNQVIWTDTTRDPTDPNPLDSNLKIKRKTATRTTTRAGYGDLPDNVDNITDHLYIQLEPNDPAFLSPSRGGPHALSSSETPEQDNVSYYLGLHNRHGHQGSPQHAIHPAPNRHNAIKDNISIA